MTSVLPEEDSDVLKLKHKLLNDTTAKEETRSFLNFSRENLSMAHADFEQGFSKPNFRFRPKRNTILSTTGLLIALLCLCLETWKLRCSLSNSSDIEELKRDVEKLKHRFLQEDLLDELKSFEKQLYAAESGDEGDPGEADIDNVDYDPNYDEEISSPHDYSEDYRSSSASDVKSTDFSQPMVTSNPTIHNPVSDKSLVEILATVRQVEEKRGQEFKKNSRENHRNIETEPEGSVEPGQNVTKQKRDVHVDIDDKGSTVSSSKLVRWYDRKQKRSALEEVDASNASSTRKLSSQRNARNRTRKFAVSRLRSYLNGNTGEEIDDDKQSSTSAFASSRRPPKKYHTHSRSEASRAFPSTHSDDNLNDEFTRSIKRLGEGTEDIVRKIWSEVEDRVNPTTTSRKLRGVTKRHLRAPRQVYAVHYGADSSLFSEEDEHTGNGRARHGNGIFKAWRPSDWVADLGMNRHFTLANDGRLTVHESGLYLAYAQIHYLDEHDENGFHLLVNGRPIFQCMVYSPTFGHKSRSCFSAQVTLLQTGDNVVLKDIGSSRYTLFQHDKSFFGLVKLGESRQPQRHQSQQLPQQ